MNPKLGEVWMVDMGMVGKIRPAVVVLDDLLTLERAIIVHVPITSQNRGTELEVPLGHLRFLTPESVANVQAIGSLPKTRFERKLGVLPAADLEKVRQAMRVAFGL
ncbi:MAG: type II toxin-antitoxin system PemK/MazF family toxin [Verrucomicrobia bacterium]|jgi:mRNA interferase MazF|nr:type II toxin-antitoxin system PemK/MazF family toxin [Verrucomicrobiota bacterium]